VAKLNRVKVQIRRMCRLVEIGSRSRYCFSNRLGQPAHSLGSFIPVLNKEHTRIPLQQEDGPAFAESQSDLSLRLEPL
jgi:hypothetical protein